MRLYLVRHGETEWNRWDKLQGQVNIPLNENGERQAEKLAKVLAGQQFDTIYSSPLSRCVSTAEIVCGKDANIELNPIIVEMAFGIYEGFNFGDMTIDESHDLFTYFYDRINYEPPAGAESIEDVVERAKIFLNEMLGKHQNEKVIAFTHGAFLRCAIAFSRGLSIAEEKLIRPIHNCSVTVMKNVDDKIVLEQEAVDVIHGEKLKLI